MGIGFLLFSLGINLELSFFLAPFLFIKLFLGPQHVLCLA